MPPVRRYFRKFYQYFPDEEIWNACVPNLNWTQFRSLLRVPDENARIWYMNEAVNEGWSSRTLDRNISTQYYYRLLKSPSKENILAEMKEKTSDYQKNSFEMLKNPIIAEFLGFKNEDSYLESDLEAAIISHIRDFLMEMGRGFAFVARQQHIVTETDEDIARYSVLHDNNHLFMSKYLTCLPTKEQLKMEIERQKEIFYMQHPDADKIIDD